MDFSRGDEVTYSEVDGSVKEGGGQVLRMAAVFSVLLRKPIHVSHIRAGRGTPGLRPQHLTGLQLLNDLCNGKLGGASVGNCEIWFNPSVPKGGAFVADTGTAGSISLLVQVALPCLLFADSPTKLTLHGGTNTDFAPQMDYLLQVFKPMIQLFGVYFDCDIVKRGYYPKGGGEVVVSSSPVSHIQPVELLDCGQVKKIYGRAWVAGTLPFKVQCGSGVVANFSDRIPVNSFHENSYNITCCVNLLFCV